MWGSSMSQDKWWILYAFFKKEKKLWKKIPLVFILCCSTCGTFAKGLMDKIGGTLAPNLYFHLAIKREHLFNHKTLKEGKFNKVEYLHYPT